MSVLSYSLITLLILSAAGIIILSLKLLKRPSDELLHQKIDLLKDELNRNLLAANNRFSETQNSIVSQLSSLYQEIGSINKEADEILSLTKSVSGILQPTKKRGIAGENILEQLVYDVLPREMVIPQYTFSNNKKVDFLIKLPSGSVPVDAKFSLDAFQNYIEAQDSEKNKLKRSFTDSIKKRIDETASYIIPDEGTFDFSMMYVPSEAVYYFIITETDILDYARKKKVFITGPSSFYIYLQTLFIGTEALKIEKQAKYIYNSMKQMEKDIDEVIKECSVLGLHIRNSSVKFEDVKRKIETFKLKINSLKTEKYSTDENKSESNPQS